MKKRIAWAVILSVLFVVMVYTLPVSRVAAQKVAAAIGPTPSLTETQKLQITNMLQRLQIAQLQLQAAQNELKSAATDGQALFNSLKVEGYDLDLQKLEYVKKPKAEK